MKKILTTVLAVGAVVFVCSGCATPIPYGVIFTEVTLPVGASSNTGGAKVGTSKCQSVLGLVATGDASIDTAKKNGGITRVTHVDFQARNILGIIGDYTTTVYGD
jgi:hypothetical protein